MINDEFLSLFPSSIGELLYKKKIEFSKEYQERYIDTYTNQTMHVYIQNDILMPVAQSLDPVSAYQKARLDAKAMLEKDSSMLFIFDFQIGNKEMMKKMDEIESSLSFLCWDNPSFVKIIKEDYKKGLENGNYPI